MYCDRTIVYTELFAASMAAPRPRESLYRRGPSKTSIHPELGHQRGGCGTFVHGPRTQHAGLSQTHNLHTTRTTGERGPSPPGPARRRRTPPWATAWADRAGRLPRGRHWGRGRRRPLPKCALRLWRCAMAGNGAHADGLGDRSRHGPAAALHAVPYSSAAPRLGETDAGSISPTRRGFHHAKRAIPARASVRASAAAAERWRRSTAASRRRRAGRV